MIFLRAAVTTGKIDMADPRYKIGLIVPANNTVIEPEFWSLALDDTAFYSTRVMAKGNLTKEAVFQMEETVDRAVDELAATGVDLIVYADMVTTFIMDPEWNDVRTKEISERSGIPCISAWTALRDGLETMGLSSFALGTPYPTDIHTLAPPYFRSRGYTITSDETLNIVSMRDVPKVAASEILEFARRLSKTPCEAIILLATDLRTFDVIELIEDELGIPLLTSNQTILWSALRTLQFPLFSKGRGKLFLK